MSEGVVESNQFNPFDPEVMACPYPHLSRLRAEAPVVWSAVANAFVVTSHELLLDVLRRPKVFSSQFGRAGRQVPAEWQGAIDEVIGEGYPRVSVLLTSDPPAHTRYRRLVSKAFAPAGIARFEPVMRRIAERLVDSWTSGEVIDFVERFSTPLPVESIAQVMNVPDDHLGEFKAWSDATASAIGTEITVDGLLASERSINEFQRYFAEQLELRRVEPQDDLLTHLLTTDIDDEDEEVVDRRPLDMAEMLRILQMILVAGNETTTSLLGDMMRILGRRPEEWQRMRADPAHIPVVIEEALRFASPNGGIWRVAAADTELGGVTIPAGSRLIVTFMSANRDEAVFGDDAASFRPDRDRLGEHLAFGSGPHFCLGAALSRLETRIAMEVLTSRVASFELVDDSDGYAASYFLRVPDQVKIRPILA
jgi:cytochrome P450